MPSSHAGDLSTGSAMHAQARGRRQHTCTLRMAAGFWQSRNTVQVSTLAVVSCPATSMPSRSSRSCCSLASSRDAMRKRRMLGSSSFTYSSAPAAAARSSSSTISLHACGAWRACGRR